MNKWLGSGRLTDNPIIRYDKNKSPYVIFTVMCVRDGKIPDGGQAVDFIDCKCIGRNVEFARNFLAKDKKVEISGRLESGHYTAEDGKKVYTKTVLVQEINFGETKAEEEARKHTKETNQAKEANQTPPPLPADATFPDIPDNFDGLPFR